MNFSVEAFKAAAVSDTNADRYTPMPEGDYTGTISKVDIAGGESARGPWARYDVIVDVQDPTTERQRGVRASIMLDLTDNGGLAVGPNRNVKLGQFRTAIGKNVPGKPFQWEDALGCTVTFTLGHRVDKDDATKVYEDVKSFKAA